MKEKLPSILVSKLDQNNLNKLQALGNPDVVSFIEEYIELCNPDKVFVRTDSEEDIAYLRHKAIELKEERELKTEGHTIHFDGPKDQARDKNNTRYILPAGSPLKSSVNSIERQQGLQEIRALLKNIMVGKEMFVCFFSLGPLNSEFSLIAVQITDSSYVAHSEDILYRPGYEQLKKKKGTKDFFKFVHSAGELINHCSKNVDKRRVYIDLENELVYSVNTQYAGNTVGLKKLSLRLAIQKASREGWLAEHMFLMGVKDLDGNKAYFCGAYPSMCGKTSTAMISGETIVGDDIVYIRSRKEKAYAVNVERGIFGIIKDVNAEDDPQIFKALNTEGEVIFSNILVDENNMPYWIGKDDNLPARGINYSGEWSPGKKDIQGNEIEPSHKNARYTIKISDLENVDKNFENPEGVEIRGLIYGGRDSDTSSPVEQSLSWQHGIVLQAASLESETTAATLGKEGLRSFNPMSNMDFLSISLGKYIQVNLDFANSLKNPPKIFAVNYFLRGKDGKFLNSIQDKKIWLKWIRLRVDNQLKALFAPTGYIPKYQDLKELFEKVLAKTYGRKDYDQQFTLRIPETLAKIERVRKIFKGYIQIPDCVFKELDAQEERLKNCQREFGDYVLPEKFKEVD
ncbi:MAG: phosphoenolpyruvate carboxykinase (GTP) [Candidatus Omnitrophica bacterium]|nr:phosphoenolpyruvate carboxykinase (GTP) [Candidatus Omnitrophota bacterium]